MRKALWHTVWLLDHPSILMRSFLDTGKSLSVRLFTLTPYDKFGINTSGIIGKRRLSRPRLSSGDVFLVGPLILRNEFAPYQKRDNAPWPYTK